MNINKLGALIWTGCGAAWAVLAYVTGVPEAAVVACASLLVAYVFNEWRGEDD